MGKLPRALLAWGLLTASTALYAAGATIGGGGTTNSPTTLPLPTGASTAAKQPALGTAGVSSADVVTVQGIASGTALPVSIATVPSHAVTNAGTFAVQAAQSGMGTQAPGTITCSTTTRPNDTTPYASADLVANNTSAGSVTAGTCTITAGVYDLLDAGLLTSSTSVINGSFRLHLYTSTPTVTNGDNAAWLSPNAGYACAFDITVDRAFSDGAWGRGLSLTQTPCRITSAGTISYLIEARAAYTPTANETFIPKLTL